MRANRPLAAIAVCLLFCGRIRAEQRWQVLRAGETTTSQEILDALEQPTRADFIETPLPEVLRFLSDYHDIRIRANVGALDDVGLDPKNIRVTKTVKDTSLRSVLKVILDEHDLVFIVRDPVLRVTTP